MSNFVVAELSVEKTSMISFHPQRVQEWYENHFEAKVCAELWEYLAALRYHLEVCNWAHTSSMSGPHEFRPTIDPALDKISIDMFHQDELIKYGDITIREAASSLDMGLQLINYLFQLEIEKGKVTWAKDGLLRRALEHRDSSWSRRLLNLLNYTYNSKGYQLFNGYRNWVTHRGAPRIIQLGDPYYPIEIPIDLRRLPNDAEKQWKVQHFVSEALDNVYAIQCYRFVPNIMQEISMDIEKAEQEIRVAGFQIDAGVTDISIKNARQTVGTLYDPVEIYDANNMLDVSSGDAFVMREPLATYTPRDYRMGINDVFYFVDRAFNLRWDTMIADILEERFQENK